MARERFLDRQVEKERQTEEAVIPQATVPNDYGTGILFLMSDDTETSFDVKENQVEKKYGAGGKAEEVDERVEENRGLGSDSLYFQTGSLAKGNPKKKVCIDAELILGNPASYDCLRMLLCAGLQVTLFSDNFTTVSSLEFRNIVRETLEAEGAADIADYILVHPVPARLREAAMKYGLVVADYFVDWMQFPQYIKKSGFKPNWPAIARSILKSA